MVYSDETFKQTGVGYKRGVGLILGYRTTYHDADLCNDYDFYGEDEPDDEKPLTVGELMSWLRNLSRGDMDAPVFIRDKRYRLRAIESATRLYGVGDSGAEDDLYLLDWSDDEGEDWR